MSTAKTQEQAWKERGWWRDAEDERWEMRKYCGMCRDKFTIVAGRRCCDRCKLYEVMPND